MKDICLNMIVKNESHIIINTLENLCSKITFDYWVICDTGSTDNTPDLIKDFFRNKNIPGELHFDSWVDFGYNRTNALSKAYNKSDYLLIFDADDSIEGDFPSEQNLKEDMISLKFNTEFVYWRPLLINNRKKWCFKGVLHEYLQSLQEDNITRIYLQGDYYLVSGKTGNRNKDDNKYLNDATILEKAIVTEQDIGLKNRYHFYLGQSYYDAEKIDQAIPFYKYVIEHNCWKQEQYVSCIKLGMIYEKKKDVLNSIMYFQLSDKFDPERIEGLVMLCKICLQNKLYYTIKQIYNDVLNKTINYTNKLFVYTCLYDDNVPFFYSVAAFYINETKIAYDITINILINNKLENNKLLLTYNNLMFYKNFISSEEIGKIKIVFENYNLLLKKKSKLNSITHDERNVWEFLYNQNKPQLIKYPINLLHSNKKNPKIMLTFTTCKRLNLFNQTINSILNTWQDLDLIEHWFCVDDNSSEEDRLVMKTKYPWIEYYFKNEDEKGHLISMNMIWEKLCILKPYYWVHIEDDFLFFKNNNYITKGIKALEKLKNKNVKQVLFNRCYGETICDYNICSYKSVDDEISIHHYEPNKKSNILNCYYWPHFSFRPSICEVNSILELGNFESKNVFFEMDYASKYTKQGYSSAFFNEISCLHIGKLTNEITDLKNAYQMNNVSQF